MKFKRPYFSSALGYSQMIRHAGSTTGIVHADMTFQKLAKLCMLVAMTVGPRNAKLVVNLQVDITSLV